MIFNPAFHSEDPFIWTTVTTLKNGLHERIGLYITKACTSWCYRSPTEKAIRLAVERTGWYSGTSLWWLTFLSFLAFNVCWIDGPLSTFWVCFFLPAETTTSSPLCTLALLIPSTHFWRTSTTSEASPKLSRQMGQVSWFTMLALMVRPEKMQNRRSLINSQ